MMNKQAALEGDVCACQCDPLPVMIASQSDMYMTLDGEGLTDIETHAASMGKQAAGMGDAQSMATQDVQPKSSPASSFADAEPSTYTPDPVAASSTDIAARGVSEGQEAECFEQHERDMVECRAYSGSKSSLPDRLRTRARACKYVGEA